MPYKVGLTGGIATGKSEVATLFQQHRIAVIDADQIARELVEPDTTYYQQIVTLFGQACLLEDRHLNRRHLREQVFNNHALKKQLEQILHPAVRQTMLQRAEQQQSPYVILMVPLLFETGMNQIVDRTLTVDSPEPIQFQRLCSRDQIDIDSAKNMLSQQFGRQHRLQLSDDIIDNSGSLVILFEQVDKLHHRYLQLAKQIDY